MHSLDVAVLSQNVDRLLADREPGQHPSAVVRSRDGSEARGRWGAESVGDRESVCLRYDR